MYGKKLELLASREGSKCKGSHLEAPRIPLRRFHVKKVVPLVDLRPLSQQRRYLLAVHALVAALAVAVVTVAPGNLGQGCQGGGTKKKDGKGTHFGARSLPGLG